MKFYRLSGATFYNFINTIYQFIKPFVDNKMSIFEEYGVPIFRVNKVIRYQGLTCSMDPYMTKNKSIKYNIFHSDMIT